VGRNMGGVNYEKVFANLRPNKNVRVHYVVGLGPYELVKCVDGSFCVVICCKETKYTVGLTTVVEALALGLPVICSRNPQIPIDFDGVGCGITVPYYDADGWEKAVRFMLDHPAEAQEMGRRGRSLAEREFNDERCAKEMADLLKSVVEN